MANYIYSGASNSYLFELPGDRRLVILGGANVTDKNHLWTPRGVYTEVTDEELAELKKLPSFNNKVDRGRFYISTKKVDVDDVADDLAGPDGSSQLPSEEFVNEGGAPPEEAVAPSKKRGRK